MMISSRFASICIAVGAFWVLTAPCAAQAPPDKPKPDEKAAPAAAGAEAVDPELIRLHLLDGSTIAGKLAVKQIEVETQFGKLTVPITALRSFTPGTGHHPQAVAQVGQWIEQLGSVDFEQREAAQRELAKLGSGIRAELEKRQDDKDNERRNRIKALLAEMENEAEDEDAPPRQERDVIETTEFTIVGSLLTKDFAVESRYGTLNVKLADIRRAQRDAGRQPELRKTVTVAGTQLVQAGLKGSGVKLEKGDKVTITAEGQLMMTPWGNGAVSGPDGAGNFGWYIAPGVPSGTIPTGSLIGSVGANGRVFKIGSKHSFHADRSGELSLAVAMLNEQANQHFPGKYTVRIRVERK